MENYYEILKVVNFADDEVIRASYKALVKKYHPDINKSVDPNIMVKINAAYDVLSNPLEKAKYDCMLKEDLSKEKNKMNTEGDLNKKHSKSNNVQYTQKPKYRFARIILGLVLSTFFGIIVSFIVMNILPSDGTWSFIAYPFLGGLIGSLVKRISGNQNETMGYLSALIAIFCLIYPYYMELQYDIQLYAISLSKLDFFLNVIEEITNTLLGSGVIRMIFVLLTPYIAYTSTCE